MPTEHTYIVLLFETLDEEPEAFGLFHEHDAAIEYRDKMLADNPHQIGTVLPVKPAE